jgi:hypothetical protein
MMTEKQHTFSRGHILNFEICSFLGLAMCSLILTYDADPVAPRQPQDHERINQCCALCYDAFRMYEVFTLTGCNPIVRRGTSVFRNFMSWLLN